MKSPWRQASAPLPVMRKTAGRSSTTTAPARIASRRLAVEGQVELRHGPTAGGRDRGRRSRARPRRRSASASSACDVVSMAQRSPAARAAASPGRESSTTTQRRAGMPSASRARLIPLGIGLAGAHVLRGDDLGEVRAAGRRARAPARSPGATRRRRWRAGGPSSAAASTKSTAPGHQPHVRPDRALVVPVLPLDRRLDRRLVHRAAVAGEGEAEAFAVVEAQVLAVVGLAIQRMPTPPAWRSGHRSAAARRR